MHIIKKRRIIPTDIAIVTPWNEAKRHGIASINGLNFFVDDSALCEPYKTPKVGDKIIVYKYRKTEKGGRIEEGKLEGTTVLSGGDALYASKTVGCQVKVSKRMVLIALVVILIVIAAIVIVL